jgi:hypothetical protein
LGGGTTIASSTSKNKNLINARNFAAEKLESLYLQQTNPSSKLPNSTMICVEKLVVECIKLANSLISESVTQMELVKWKREVLGKKIRGEGAHTVGYTWRRNFVKRRKVHLSIGKAVRFDMRRNEWCKMENFETMHDFIYNNPEKLIFVDEVGETTSQANDSNKMGTKYITAQQQNSFTDCHYTTLGFTVECRKNERR